MPAVMEKKNYGVKRVDSDQDMRLPSYLGYSERGEDQEPDEYDGTKDQPHARRAVTLKQKQPDQNCDCNWNQVRIKDRRCDPEPFNGAQHRDRRRNHAIPVQKGRPKQPPHYQQPMASLRRGTDRRDERSESKYPALALIIRPQDEDKIFDRNHYYERPQDEREDSKHVSRCNLDGVRAVKTF